MFKVIRWGVWELGCCGFGLTMCGLGTLTYQSCPLLISEVPSKECTDRLRYLLQASRRQVETLVFSVRCWTILKPKPKPRTFPTLDEAKNKQTNECLNQNKTDRLEAAATRCTPFARTAMSCWKLESRRVLDLLWVYVCFFGCFWHLWLGYGVAAVL